MGFKTTLASARAQADALVDRVDQGSGAGKLLIYDGTVPATAATAITTQTLLATVVLGDPAFGAAADDGTEAVATANGPIGVVTIAAAGTPTFFRVVDSDNVVVWQDDPVGATGSGAALEVSDTEFDLDKSIQVTSFTYRQPTA